MLIAILILYDNVLSGENITSHEITRKYSTKPVFISPAASFDEHATVFPLSFCYILAPSSLNLLPLCSFSNVSPRQHNSQLQ